MIQIERVLCPVDLSELSRWALDHAIAIAAWYEARLEVLYVAETLHPYPGTDPTAPAWIVLRPELHGPLRSEVERFAGPALEAGLATHVEVREGFVVSTILEEAAHHDADLVVMGTHGRGGFERWVLGSVTEKVLRKAACPVLAVAHPGEGRVPSGPVLFKHILCPLDFSEASLRALRYALSLAQQADAELTLLHVLEWPVERWTPDRDAQLEWEREALARLRQAVPESARDWCRPHEKVVHGKAWREILREAAEGAAELVVMGVHGRGAIDLMLFGSTTHHVIRGASCPVLTLRG
jgi:nucleotide-binding universal stress UspA family protein